MNLFIILLLLSLVLFLISVYCYDTPNKEIMIISGVTSIITGLGLLFNLVIINSKNYIESYVYSNSSQLITKSVEYIPYSDGYVRFIAITIIGFGILCIFPFIEQARANKRSNK